MNSDLNYLTTTYADQKKIEEYNTPYKEEEEMLTGEAIIDDWHTQCRGYRLSENGMDHLIKRIDEALGKARTEGEIAGAERMVEVVRKTMV